jgi:ATP-dependent Clp protease protease subunit
MSKRTLPVVTLPSKPGAQADLNPSAMEKWNPGLQVTASVSDDRSISVLDPIGSGFFYEGVTAKRVAAALRSMGAGPVTVNVNSPGGDFFEGLAIYNLLREHEGHVTVKILGMAASAASAIAMAGDEVLIARAGFLMIHNTQVCACGDRHGLTDVAEWLEPFDTALADIYSIRTSTPLKDVAAMLDKETWIGGSRAVEMGFADDLLPSDYVAPDNSDETPSNSKMATVQADALFAKLGVSVTERRSLIAALKGGKPGAVSTSTPGAADDGMRDAALKAGVGALLEKLS